MTVPDLPMLSSVAAAEERGRPEAERGGQKTNPGSHRRVAHGVEGALVLASRVLTSICGVNARLDGGIAAHGRQRPPERVRRPESPRSSDRGGPIAPRAHMRDTEWLRTARRARWLSYFSLVWMMAEGILGLIAGAEAHSIGVIAWAIGSAVEAAAAVIVIVRLTGRNRFSQTAEQRAQRWVAGSFFVLVPYILYEAVSKLLGADAPQRNWLAIVLLASSIVLMPVLGWAKLRLGRRLSSGATAGEGTQNLLCAVQGAVGLVGLLLGSAGAGFLDPVAALVIAAVAAKEGVELWRGDGCACHSMPGLEARGAAPADQGCGCC